MTKLLPPNNSASYNGQKASAEGLEVKDNDVEALIARGWKKAAAESAPAKQKPQKPKKAAEMAEEKNED